LAASISPAFSRRVTVYLSPRAWRDIRTRESCRQEGLKASYTTDI
jgi:hypothetical protein